MPPPPRRDNKRGKNTKKRPLPAFTVLVFLLAYTFGGAPLIFFSPLNPQVIPCRQFCIPLLTSSNSFGEKYSNIVFSTLKSLYYPARMNGRTIQMRSYFTLGALEIKGNTLNIPSVYSGLLYSHRIALTKGEKIKLQLLTKSDAPPPVELILDNGQKILPSHHDTNNTTWQLEAPGDINIGAKIFTAGGSAFSIKEITIEKSY